ncbi:hypothetical protein ACP4OV_009745 [Aristida adscensionis]
MEMTGVVTAADSPGASAAAAAALPRPSRYESQKRRDWQTFGQYLRNHRPPLELARCSGAHVLEFLRYLDQFGKTKVHAPGCPFFGLPSPPAPCPCPLRQAWGSLDALVGRLRAAFEENGGRPDANPFGARAVRLYLRDVRDSQAKARGIAYEKKRRKRNPPASKQPKHHLPAQDHHHHHHAPAAAAAASSAAASTAALADRRAEAPDPAPHFLMPHAHFFHSHHFLAPATVPADAAAGGVAGAGEDMVMAMAAAAEAHAAGCMLSVFH